MKWSYAILTICAIAFLLLFWKAVFGLLMLGFVAFLVILFPIMLILDPVDDDNEEHDREMQRLQARDDYYGQREEWWER